MDEKTEEEKDEILKDFLKQCGAKPTSPGLSVMPMSFSVLLLFGLCGFVSFRVGFLWGVCRLVSRREQPRQGRALAHAARHARRARPDDQGLWPPPAYTGKAAHEERQKGTDRLWTLGHRPPPAAPSNLRWRPPAAAARSNPAALGRPRLGWVGAAGRIAPGGPGSDGNLGHPAYLLIFQVSNVRSSGFTDSARRLSTVGTLDDSLDRVCARGSKDRRHK